MAVLDNKAYPFRIYHTFMYMAPRPPPRPLPLVRGVPLGVRPRPPREPLPPRLPRPLGVSGDLVNTSSTCDIVFNTTFSSGVSPNMRRPSVVDDFRLLLDRGVAHVEGILSRASVIRGSFIRELVGSISSVGFCSSRKFGAVSTIGSAGRRPDSSRLAPRPRPLNLVLASIAGRSL